jgi:hypothetical protein
MDLSEIVKSTSAQDAGHEFELLDPVRGEPTGIKLTVAGPDSEIARKARHEMEKEINRQSARRGGLTPEGREQIMDEFFGTVVLGWNAKEAGKAVPFSKEAFLRLLKAGTWVRAQVDAFAGDRSPYFKTKGAA